MIEIRRAQAEDVPACAAVVNDWIDATDWMPRIFTHREIEGFIRAAFPNRVIWVAGDPVHAYLSFDPETEKIGALYCRRTGAGIGRALIDRARRGREFVWLTTHEPNHAAQRFYARHGFVETARFDPEPPEVVREVRMEWRR